MNRTQALRGKPFNADEWQKLYYRNQQQYIRQRLTAIELLQEGQSRAQVSEQVGCRYDNIDDLDRQILGRRIEQLSEPNSTSKAESVDLSATTATQRHGADTTTHRLRVRSQSVDRSYPVGSDCPKV